MVEKLEKSQNSLNGIRPVDIQNVQSLTDLKNIQFGVEISKSALKEIKQEFDVLWQTADQSTPQKAKIFKSIKLIFESKSFKCEKVQKFVRTLLKDKSERIKQRKHLFASQHSKTSVEIGTVKHRSSNVPLENEHLLIDSKAKEAHEKGTILFEKDLSIEKDNQKLKKVNKALDKVVSNFQKMGEIVSMHSQMFDDIEMKTTEAKVLVGKGKKTIQDIYEDVNSHRGFIVKIFGVLTMIAIVYLILK